MVSVDTVKGHLHALFELFGVRDMPQNRKRAELVRRVFERGLAGVIFHPLGAARRPREPR